MKFFLVLIAFFYFCKLNAQEDLGKVDVIGTSPLPGILIDRKDIPHTSQKITETQIQENLTKTITDLMNENFSGISVKDVQNGAFPEKKNIVEIAEDELDKFLNNLEKR